MDGIDIDEEAPVKGYRWETEYEKTWEAIRETDDGLLQPSIEDMIHKAKRKRLAQRKDIKLGIMRYLYIVIDMSQFMLEIDVKPNRIQGTLKLVKNFVNEFFSQNPISKVGIITTRNKRAEKSVDLTSNVNVLKEAVDKLYEVKCIGEPSLHNCLEICINNLKHIPKHTSKEALFIFGSINTCDPCAVTETIDQAAMHNIRCSVVGLSAHVKIFSTVAKKTKGTYEVIMDESHFQDLVNKHLLPPPATANSEASLIRMGFPQFLNEGQGKPSMCVCHLKENFSTTGFFCPQCKAKYCDLPIDCQVCGLTLVSSIHLSRSYQHLFPVDLFSEIDLQSSVDCFSCQIEFLKGSQCTQCLKNFCTDCDIFIHETMHLCPGCASDPLHTNE